MSMNYALVSLSDDYLYDVGGMGSSSTRYQKIMFWTLCPAILLIPLFTVFGKEMFGGPEGWVEMMFMYTVAPVCAVYHVLLFGLAFAKNRKRFFNDTAEYCLSRQASHLLVLYYLCHIGVQLNLNDSAGDQELTTGSVMTKKFGLAPSTCDDFVALFGNAAIFLASCLLVHIYCFEKIEIVRQTPPPPTAAEMSNLA